MIVSHRCEFVYIGPPRTGSTTLHRWLSQPALCEVRSPDNPSSQHKTKIPAVATDFFTFGSIRHPCGRAVSLWALGQTSKRLGRPVPKMTFPEFVRDWLPTAWWFYGRAQADYFKRLRMDALVRLECLSLDLLALSPIRAALDGGARLEPIPQLNTTDHLTWGELVTPELAELLAEHWPADLALWEGAGRPGGG